MNEQLKVGMSSRVFEVIQDSYSINELGFQSVERLGEHHGNIYGVDLFCRSLMAKYLHYGIDDRNHLKLIGKLTITKVK